MFEPNSKSSRNEARLAARALQEANRASPEFSLALHAKIMRAVGSADRAAQVIRRPSRSFWLRISVIPAGLAAMVTLCVSPLPGRLFFATPTVVETPARISVTVAVAVPAVADKPLLEIDQAAHDMNTRLKDVLQTAMVSQQWAGLDHDVLSATRYFVDQVPLRLAWDNQDSDR